MKENYLIQIGAVMIGLVIFAFVALFTGVIVMLLWNWLMPQIFSLPTITYFQGWGLSFLSGILFKGTQAINSNKN